MNNISKRIWRISIYRFEVLISMKHCLKLTFAEVLISINSIEYCRTMDTKADRVAGKTSTAI